MRLLLISLDGLWKDDFSFLKSLTHIGGMIRSGVSCKNVQTIYPALTYPVHATILTGCRPELHGISHNQPFVSDRPPESRPWYWEESMLRKPTIHQLVYKAGGKTASILWPVTGKSRFIRWNFPEVLALPHENQTLKMLHYGSAAWILSMELRYGRQRRSIHQPDLDDYATLLGEKLLLGSHPPDLLTLHLVDCDEMRHVYGAGSRESKEAIMRLDERVGRLLDAIYKRDLTRDTVVALVSDHGLADVERPVSLNDSFTKAGLIGICHAQSTGMGAFIHFSRDIQENAGRVRSFLEENRQMLGIQKIYESRVLKKMGAGREICLAVEAMPSIAFVDDLKKEKRVKATHGFGPDHPASQCLMIMKGPGVKKGISISHANMEDIAPSLMHVIGRSMPSAQGKTLTECFEKDKKVEN